METYKGLYIISSELFEKNGVIKFGMTLNFSKRILFYKKFAKNPRYEYCYLINMNKSDILDIEFNILEKTKHLWANGWQTEYRKIKVKEMHKIITDYLDEKKIIYKILISPIFIDNNIRERIQKNYVTEIINGFNNKKRKILMKAPTGFGKTTIFYKIINILKPKLCIILTPRKLLNIQNVSEKYKKILYENANMNLIKKIKDIRLMNNIIQYINNNQNKYIYFDYSNDDKYETEKKLIENNENNKIILSCYQSSEKLYNFCINKNPLLT